MNHEGDKNMLPNTEEMDTREAEAQPALDNGLHMANNRVEDSDVVMAGGGDETNSTAENNEEGGEEDEARSSATFQFTVENFSKLKESALSPSYYVRSLPWKIMVMPRVQQNDRDRHNPQRTLGIFLQCNAESESTWSCQASAELRLISCKSGILPHGRKIQHLFFNKENDWGFSNFLAWNEIMDVEKGYYNTKEDSITVQVHVVADAPHGVSWDSKKHTGYVGLKNQGATCYMNSLLQTLFFTNQLRKAVYMMPTDNDDPSKSVALGLQRVFYDLQFGDKPVGTKKLTKSFGWDAIDSFMQHDVQELCRVLLDNMESKMKGTCVEGTIPRLFEGKMLSFIKCKHIEYMSSRQEPYYDIQLNIKGKKNIYESFKDYVTVENMDGENKYDAGDHGLQEAEKGVVFLSLPPVLVLQLMRFQYDPATDTNIKINDRCEFPTKLDLDPFLQQADPKDPAHYVLHAVLVHSGDNHGGHYVVYINPRGDGKWCKFDDDVVSRATRKEATENNYGGNDDDINVRFCTNAYMLTYLRESQLDKLVEPVDEEDIPEPMKQRFSDEKYQEAQKRKERLEAHLYLNVNVVLEDDFVGHQGPDLVDNEKCHFRTFKEKKTSTVRQLLQNLADALKYPVNQIRPWLFQARKNSTFRPAHFSLEHYLDKTVEEVDDHSMTFYIETAKPGSKVPLPAFDKDNDVLLFLKRYDPKTSSITYSGHVHWPISRSLSEMAPMLCEQSGFAKNSNLLFFEEVRPDSVELIEETGAPLESLEELMDGDIIVYQRDDSDYEHYPLPTARDYFKDLFYRIEIMFCDRAQPTDPGFTLTLSQKDNYDRLAHAVGDHLLIDPYMIQFFRPAVGYGREVNYSAIRYTFDGTLKELFMNYQKPRTVRKLYYQKLTIRIDEMENKRQFKCVWVSYNLKDEKELVLYPDKNGRVSDIFAEARKQLGSASAAQKLRMLEIGSSRLSAQVRDDMILDNFSYLGAKVYRIEEVPQDETTLLDDECLVPVAHFHKEPFQTFGTPFLFKVRNGELFSKVKERIQKRLEVPDKDFEKYRFAIVTSNKATFIPEDADYKVDIQSLIVRGQQQTTSLNMRPWLGLEHLNKTVKRYNISYPEKAIKIHN